MGNNDKNRQNDPNYMLVGLNGQLAFDEAQVVIESRIVKTVDGKEIGVLLSNGKVFIR